MRAAIAMLLIVFAGIFAAVAVALWLGWVPVDPPTRSTLIIVLLGSAALDLLLARRVRR
jgi:hypothetical protein